METPVKQVGPINTCLNGTRSKILIGKNLYNGVPIQNVLKLEGVYFHCISTLGNLRNG
jgi:hypothetical protein